MSAPVRFTGENIPESFYNKVLENSDRPFFATRRDGRWRDLTGKQSLDFVLRTMKGLQALGFQRGDAICIFSDNREEWILTDYAAQWLGGFTTAIYTTSSKSAVRYILEQSETKFIFVSNQDLLHRLGEVDGLPNLRAVIAWDRVQDWNQKAKLVQREEFLKDKLDESEAKALLKQIKSEDPAILLYTSGTTGEPKGVVLSQKNIIANIRQIHLAFPLADLHRTMSFLPLSHIYERSIHTTLIFANIQIYFAEGLERLVENLAEVKPDIMIGVPRVFEKMYLRIQEKLRSAPRVRKILAKTAFTIGRATVPYRLKGQPIPTLLSFANVFADRLVLKKIRDITGGSLKYFVSGGAPLSKEIAEFFFQAGITILEGYGLSETCILSVNLPGNIKFGTVGKPFKDTFYKIAGDGEILVKGPQIMKGYFKRPDFTKEVFNEEGWFKTGDIGEIDAEGFLKITDRKKELIVTAGGKKVAPQMLENRLKAHPLIEQVCVVGDQRPYITALIVPNLDIAKSWAADTGERIETLQDCSQSPLVQKRIQTLIEEINGEAGKFETIKYFRILTHAFTIEGGELTPTMKLKRRVIEDRYHSLIEEMYLTGKKATA